MIIFTGFISLLMLYFWKTNSYRVIKVKSLFLPLTVVIFIMCLIIFSESSVKAAGRGLHLWFNVVIPSLFPFFVASEFLKGTGLIKAVGTLLEPIMYPLFRVPGSGSFAFLMGTTSGYPVGAKITSSLREEKLLSRLQAERLISFSNNSGPLFIIGAVSVGMFNSPHLGTFLLTSHIAASITVGFLFRFYGSRDNNKKDFTPFKTVLKRFKKELFSIKSPTKNLGSQMGDAVKNSISTILTVGGFIILFSVIVNILIESGILTLFTGAISVLTLPMGISNEIIASLISGFFEVTTGAKMVSSINNVDLTQKLVATSAIMGWAGLSVHSQVISIISKTDIRPAPYIVGKLIHGVFSAIYTYLGIKFLSSAVFSIIPAFSPYFKPDNFYSHIFLLYSLKYLGVTLLIILILCLAVYILKSIQNLT